MKSVFLFLIVLMTLPAWGAKTGLGISIGNPTGLNGKRWLNDKAAVDGGLAWSIGNHSNLSLHSDYLLHQNSQLYFNDHPLDLYYGIGGRMEFADDIELGVRIPIGLAHQLEAHSADIFGEVAPIVDLVSKTGLEMHLLFGARYYF